MRSIKTLQDVLDWDLCVGCGACFAFCDRQAVELDHFTDVGIRPVIKTEQCADCNLCLDFCPGYTLKLKKTEEKLYYPLVGQYIAIYEGYAQNEKIRFKGSSGGAITALAAFCLKRKGIDTILHTGMDKEKPWQNISVQSRTLEDLLQHTGSRYTPSSPCDALATITDNPERHYLFIGKPCDVAAVTQLRHMRPAWEEKIRLSISFFCAGPPSHTASLKLLTRLGLSAALVKRLMYRGDGWPGGFKAFDYQSRTLCSLPYLEAWSFLAKNRPFRCHLCPDGLGEFSDITCGDAWHKYSPGTKDPGRSIIIARTSRGQSIIAEAEREGYLSLEPIPAADIIKAQGLVNRRKELYGRLFAMKLLLRPTPQFEGLPLKKEYRNLPLLKRIKIVLATLRRLILKGLWKRHRTGNRVF